MADQPLPVLYKDIVPISSQQHGSWKGRALTSLDFLKQIHMVPLAVEEFIDAQAFYPIIFSDGDDATPLALMAMNEGYNVFVSEDGSLRQPVYLPAYIRRYPYMLARMSPDAQDLTLCFDPTAGALGEDVDGFPLFDEGNQPSEQIKELLGFCETFEVSVQKSLAFVQELKQLELLQDGEFSFQAPGLPEPFTYRGFKIVNEQKLTELRGDQLRKLNQSGALALVYAHLFSIRQINAVFNAQVAIFGVPFRIDAAPDGAAPVLANDTATADA